ncbi:hypothetical protein BDZ90DRAFT_188952 [Jaminaea rosea]|uniref:Uncharacterized protein n=1 Tax=Jaminaea rosea TaxID=1569628 RepID=A0A316UQJ3_9BASI|nr:hypothetical protein BDZ90DRAFT_188952 [Jaminaea rosea]PWN27244.1 hypothetical protein BDZ90DRAFT_188952 [Jaminaea rosea]
MGLLPRPSMPTAHRRSLGCLDEDGERAQAYEHKLLHDDEDVDVLPDVSGETTAGRSSRALLTWTRIPPALRTHATSARAQRAPPMAHNSLPRHFDQMDPEAHARSDDQQRDQLLLDGPSSDSHTCSITLRWVSGLSFLPWLERQRRRASRRWMVGLAPPTTSAPLRRPTLTRPADSHLDSHPTHAPLYPLRLASTSPRPLPLTALSALYEFGARDLPLGSRGAWWSYGL